MFLQRHTQQLRWWVVVLLPEREAGFWNCFTAVPVFLMNVLLCYCSKEEGKSTNWVVPITNENYLNLLNKKLCIQHTSSIMFTNLIVKTVKEIAVLFTCYILKKLKEHYNFSLQIFQLGVVACTCNPATWRLNFRTAWVRDHWHAVVYVDQVSVLSLVSTWSLWRNSQWTGFDSEVRLGTGRKRSMQKYPH